MPSGFINRILERQTLPGGGSQEKLSPIGEHIFYFPEPDIVAPSRRDITPTEVSIRDASGRIHYKWDSWDWREPNHGNYRIYHYRDDGPEGLSTDVLVWYKFVRECKSDCQGSDHSPDCKLVGQKLHCVSIEYKALLAIRRLALEEMEKQ